MGLLFTALAIFFASSSQTEAGGGPENVLLVVNPDSPASMTIANHYIRLRDIPAGNVFYLSCDPKRDTIDIDAFRKEILAPVVEAARSRHPAGQIDYVIYSSDFPWGIKLDADIKKFDSGEVKIKNPPFTPVGAINGLTYLADPVMAGHPGYFQLRSNFYMRRSLPEQKDAPSLGFRSSDQFGQHGELVASGGRRYLLSMMLGVTAGRGNTVAEALDYLRRSAAADGTHPRGTIYYVENSDIRSRVRQGEFPAAVRELKALGVETEIIEGTVPVKKDDVQGAMLGTAGFDWKASGSKILPRAICEHFTSFGGVMSAGAGQTPLSELLRYGAAGASGTVTEPYALADKFPSPMMHVHYARGCTLAEAFYQSVFGPYQLLIVGDPLCRPWANVPKVTADGVQDGATVTGLLEIRPAATFARGPGVDHFELFVDGFRALHCKPKGTLDLDTTRLADGWHELRVVAIEAGHIQSQGRQILWVRTANFKRTIEATITPTGNVGLGETVTIAAKAPGSKEIGVFQGTRLLGKIAGAGGRFDVKAARLGSGPVRLHLLGYGEAGATSNVVSKPAEVTVREK